MDSFGFQFIYCEDPALGEYIKRKLFPLKK